MCVCVIHLCDNQSKCTHTQIIGKLIYIFGRSLVTHWFICMDFKSLLRRQKKIDFFLSFLILGLILCFFYPFLFTHSVLLCLAKSDRNFKLRKWKSKENALKIFIYNGGLVTFKFFIFVVVVVEWIISWLATVWCLRRSDNHIQIISWKCLSLNWISFIKMHISLFLFKELIDIHTF